MLKPRILLVDDVTLSLSDHDLAIRCLASNTAFNFHAFTRSLCRSSLSIDDLNEILKIYSVQADSGEDEKQRLEAFLRELLKIVHCLPQTWVERVLLPTLLELMIKSLQSGGSTSGDGR